MYFNAFYQYTLQPIKRNLCRRKSGRKDGGRSPFRSLLAGFLFACLPLSAPASVEILTLPQVTVLAPASMTESLGELSRLYAVRTGSTITLSFGPVAELARSIEEGEAADIFISDSAQWMVHLKLLGVLDVYSQTNLIKNQLAVIFPANGEAPDIDWTRRGTLGKAMEKSLGDASLFVLTDPTVSAGRAGRQSLEKFKQYTSLRRRIFYTESSRAVVDAVLSREALGMTYLTDAMAYSGAIRVLWNVPSDAHEPAIYQAAVVAGENMEPAREFLTFLKSDEARKVFLRYGFVDE